MNPGAVVFHRYQLHEQIGAGGAGRVWKATDQLLHQTVALKRVTVTGLDAEEARLTRDRALREARLAAQLRGHPHVVAVYDALIDDADIWLVMEYLPAHSLRELLEDAPSSLDHAEVARIGAAIADALAAAHDHGIEHRDVKPGNVLIGRDGTVKLTDFGISHLTGDPHLTQTGITGTPAYLAPEVAGSGESSPASDMFSLGATLYAALEGQPPFGTDDNLLQLLKVVRTGIIRPPVNAGPLEPLLLRLLHIQPTTRPDAPTTRDLLTHLASTGEHILISHARSRKAVPRWWSRWWRKPSRPVTVGAATVIIVAVTATSAVIGLRPWTDPPADPPAASPIGDPRKADPCGLLEPGLDALRPFGPVKLSIPPFPESCQATITTASGNTDVRAIFRKPAPVSELGELIRQVGDVKIFRNGEYPLGAGGCQYFLVSADRPMVEILTAAYEKPLTTNPCAVAGVAGSTIADHIDKNGITYPPDHNADYSLARTNACELLDDATLNRVAPRVRPAERKPGFADWSCTWGSVPSVDIQFYLYKTGAALGDHSKVAGKDAYLQPAEDGESCKALVVHRPAPAADRPDELFWVDVEDPAVQPTAELCTRALNLATEVEKRLSTNPRDADPCPLLIEPAALSPFGQARRTAGPLLESCENTITTPGQSRDTYLAVYFKDPMPLSEVDGKHERVGDLVIGRESSLSPSGRSECWHYLWQAEDQPVIVINTRTYDDRPINLCAVSQAASTAAITALKQNGGITYTPSRTAGYSHAGSDACATLDSTALGQIPGLAESNPQPGFANWSCVWHIPAGDTELRLELRLEEPGFRGYSDDPQRTLDGKRARVSGDSDGCDADVTHRRDPTETRATEMFRLSLKAPLPDEELCNRVADLATAVERRLPDA